MSKKFIRKSVLEKVGTLSAFDYLNNYHHKILDNYEEKEIDIDIDDNFNINVAKLKIIEEPKRLILKPKKNTKKNV